MPESAQVSLPSLLVPLSKTPRYYFNGFPAKLLLQRLLFVSHTVARTVLSRLKSDHVPPLSLSSTASIPLHIKAQTLTMASRDLGTLCFLTSSPLFSLAHSTPAALASVLSQKQRTLVRILYLLPMLDALHSQLCTYFLPSHPPQTPSQFVLLIST